MHTRGFYFWSKFNWNKTFTKWSVIIINHHEEDWKPGHYDSFVKIEPNRISDVKNDDFGKI